MEPLPGLSPLIQFGEIEAAYGTAEASQVFFGLITDIELGPAEPLRHRIHGAPPHLPDSARLPEHNQYRMGLVCGPEAGGRDDPPSELRLFRPSDGAQVILPDTLPRIEHIEGSTAWGWRNLPFPQVVRMSVPSAGPSTPTI